MITRMPQANMFHGLMCECANWHRCNHALMAEEFSRQPVGRRRTYVQDGRGRILHVFLSAWMTVGDEEQKHSDIIGPAFGHKSIKHRLFRRHFTLRGSCTVRLEFDVANELQSQASVGGEDFFISLNWWENCLVGKCPRCFCHSC